VSSALIPGLGFRFSSVLGFGLMAGGVGALGLGNWAVGLVSALCYGVGLGLTIPATNLLVAQANPNRRAAALSVLNLAWGVGAVALPLVAALLQGIKSTRALLFGLAAALGLMSAGLSRASFGSLWVPQEASPPSQPRGSLWRDRFIPIVGVLFFLYVGTENALGGWVASYALRVTPTPGTAWALTPSFFWGGLLLGRAVAPVLLRRMAETGLVLIELLLAVIGVTILLAAGTLADVVAGASLAGLGLAPVFPITVAVLTHRFGTFASRVAGSMFALGGLGGATLPWLVGFSSTRYGSLKAGLVVPLLGSLSLLALCLLNARSTAGGFGPCRPVTKQEITLWWGHTNSGRKDDS
ncbi:MAG TPA: MFS transporter, partial [Candidatus Acidoferrales bacterium]|nr:MFS transporter [Candidatus Acidoferrales bacterium]